MTEELIYKINPSEVTVKDRQRKKIKKNTLADLAKSIDDIGQLHPGICYLDEEEKLTLLIGERRLRACQLLQTNFSYRLKEEITDKILLRQIELEENLRRENLDWADEVAAKKELHELYQVRFGLTTQGASGGHKLSDTAEHLGESLGLVAGDIELAMWSSEIPEVADAKNKTQAKKIIERLKKGVKRRIALKEALGADAPKLVEEDLAEGSQGEIVNTKDMVRPKVASDTQKLLAEFDKRCRLGKMEDILAGGVADELIGFDIVLFDPPWGVNFDKVALDNGDKETYQDSQEDFEKRLLGWLELIYDVMSENSHLYMFFGIVHHQFVYDTLEQVGFTTNRIPINWHKVGAHRTRNPEIWPGRCYEPIAYARKGSKPLFKLGSPDIIPTPPPSPFLKQDHPSAKHPDIYIELLRRSASPGDRVLDPTAGSGMVGVACEYLRSELALDWTMIEEKATFRDLELMNLLKGYDNLVKVQLVPPADFKTLTPGSPEYMNYWKGHPEEQEAMTAWMAEKEEEKDVSS